MIWRKLKFRFGGRVFRTAEHKYQFNVLIGECANLCVWPTLLSTHELVHSFCSTATTTTTEYVYYSNEWIQWQSKFKRQTQTLVHRIRILYSAFTESAALNEISVRAKSYKLLMACFCIVYFIAQALPLIAFATTNRIVLDLSSVRWLHFLRLKWLNLATNKRLMNE